MNSTTKTYRRGTNVNWSTRRHKGQSTIPLNQSKALPFWFASGNPVPSYVVHKDGSWFKFRWHFFGAERYSQKWAGKNSKI